MIFFLYWVTSYASVLYVTVKNNVTHSRTSTNHKLQAVYSHTVIPQVSGTDAKKLLALSPSLSTSLKRITLITLYSHIQAVRSTRQKFNSTSRPRRHRRGASEKVEKIEPLVVLTTSEPRSCSRARGANSDWPSAQSLKSNFLLYDRA